MARELPSAVTARVRACLVAVLPLLVGPVAANMSKIADDEHAYYHVMRVAITACNKGLAPTIAVEVGRRAVAARGLRYGAELIELLTDDEGEVRQVARRALVQLSRGLDYGPQRGASATEASEAVRLWSIWWSKQGSK